MVLAMATSRATMKVNGSLARRYSSLLFGQTTPPSVRRPALSDS
jgi:hypothetical protein